MSWNFILLMWIGHCCVMVCQSYQYRYIKEEKNWTEAQRYCREKYTDLATVSNMTDMKSLLSNQDKDMNESWIGLYDQKNGNRTWHWSLPGVKFDKNYQRWKDGEPNDAGPGVENCGFMWNSLKWGDISCNKPLYFLCYDGSNSSKVFHLIRRNPEKKTWINAQSYCRENHIDLVSGLTQLQDERLKEEVRNVDGDKFILIGLFRDTWMWSDGSSFSFRHWSLQFDNQRYNSGQCAMTVFNDEGRWINEDCALKKPFICYDAFDFILVKENKTWEEALYYCRDHHHDLVSITNLEEQRWVERKAQFASTSFVWLGLHYTCTLDFWFWVSDEVVRYKNWASDGVVDDCDMSGAMERGGTHQWLKKSDDECFNFICSRNKHGE
ncbi:macrophage mannose receptor 1-like [Cyprinodon tularosa]|uniref:macrophage mannose receptor 1-like n=1 Tax=Cyprinodon tularosa TaxID=77115 RepID=UPI0018E24DDB|nr:macrophage mannose receptor 1-like [Cyprinodon tularosa]